VIAKLRPDDLTLLFHQYIQQKLRKQDGVKSRVLGKAATLPVLPHEKKWYYQQPSVQDYWLYFQFGCATAASYHSRDSIQMYLPGDSRLVAITCLICSPHPP